MNTENDLEVLGALGHLTNPSDKTDSENARPATNGEMAFYGEPEITVDYKQRPTRGPLAGIDLVLYMRAGLVRRLDGRPLTDEQRKLR